MLSYCYSKSNDYANGNGTVIETKIDKNTKWIFRKHTQRVQIGDLAQKDNLIIYDKPALEAKSIKKLKIGDYINISQVAEAIINNEYSIWLNVSIDTINGWIFFGKYSYEYAQFCDPYFNDRCKITESININDKIWTIRKMFYQHVSVWKILNIRDKPGLLNTKVISKIVPPKDRSPQVNLEVTEVTEETETIEGKTDRWLKINYKGTVGWIFGGYASIERGGYKYYTPENIILSQLGYF